MFPGINVLKIEKINMFSEISNLYNEIVIVGLHWQ
jgi:hypothetical protein